MGLFSSTKTPKGQKKKHHRYSHGGESMKAMLRDELREDAGAAAATGPTAAERHAEDAAPAGAADATEMYKRIADWYNSPEGDALRAAWGAYPSSPETLESWPGFVAVTNAYLDHAGPPTAPAAVQFEGAVAEEEPGSPVLEDDAEAWKAHCRNVVAMVEGTVVGQTAPGDPVMAGEVVRVEAEAESEPVGASEMVPEVMEREAPAKGPTRGSVEASGPALTNETLRDWVKRWCKGKKKGLPHISTWNTSQVTDMSELFKDQVNFNDDIGAWDTSSVTTMRGMFAFSGHDAAPMQFNQNIGSWRVDKVTDMSSMFRGTSAFNQPIGGWQVDKVTNMHKMFDRAESFDQPIGGWRVDQVMDMSIMFWGAKSFNQPLNDWRVDKVTNMSRMFERAESFDQPLSDWRVDNVTNMRRMFFKASSFNQPLNDWRVDNITDMGAMFCGASSFNQPLNNWRVDNVRNMSCMFEGASSFNQPLNDWRVDNVTNMRSMFEHASRFNQPLNDWRVDNVTNMSSMFLSAYSFNHPLGDWRLRSDCKTWMMLDCIDFRNSLPVKESCCAIS